MWPVNFEILELWQSIETQWRAGYALIGLDYSEVRNEAKRLDIELSECEWRKIKVLEKWVLDKSKENQQGDSDSDD